MNKAVIKVRQKFFDNIEEWCKANPEKKKEPYFFMEWVNGEQYGINCKGTVAVHFKEPLFSLYTVKTDRKHYPIAETFNSFRENGEGILELPNLKELKSYIKNARTVFRHQGSMGNPIYSFGENEPVVDAVLLVQLMEMFPKLLLYKNRTSNIMPLYGMNGFDDENTGDECALCPVRAKVKECRTDLHKYDQRAEEIRATKRKKVV